MFEDQLIFDEIEEYAVSNYELYGRGLVLVDLIKEKMCYISSAPKLNSYLLCYEQAQPLIQKYDPEFQVVVVIRYQDALGDHRYFQEIRNLAVSQKFLN